MDTQIQIVVHGEIEERFLNQIREWTHEVFQKAGVFSPPPGLCILLWESMGEFLSFSKREKEELGVGTGEESDFLATHDAWRGYPRIHVCQERVMGIPAPVVQGAIHHELGHAFCHGSPDFYTFRFSAPLERLGYSCGMNLALLQQCVYFLSIAIKDQEVVRWLSEIELDFGQITLLEYLLSDTEEERQAWELSQNSFALRKIALAAFLKTLSPIEEMRSIGIKEAHRLRSQWAQAYAWLSEGEMRRLSLLAQGMVSDKGKIFQERLERATLRLIRESSFKDR